MAAVGSPDSRLNVFGKIDFCLSSLWQAWKHEDPPPHRVKLIPVKVLRRLIKVACFSNHVRLLAVVDMVILAFFFLLCPGEYTGTSSSTTPFAFRDTQLFIGRDRLNYASSSDADFSLADFTPLEFTSQKNGVKREVIGLGCTGDYFSPIRAVCCRVGHLCTMLKAVLSV
jgi:hypothetical protein